MFELGVGEALRVALGNAILLTSWAVLPGLLLGYTRQMLVARRIRPEFWLRKSEAVELDRALLLYDKVRNRLREINDQSKGANGYWWILFGRRIDTRQHHVEELEDLEAHAHHLRGTIIRLRRRPLQRVRSWISMLCWQFAFGGALASYIVSLAILMLAPPDSWADELAGSVGNPRIWLTFDASLFYANAVAAVFAGGAAPLFFLLRRTHLRRKWSLELSASKQLADADPDQAIDQLKADETDQDPSPQADWFAVLGLSHSATIEEVKEAYKALIKQNHPDRVHGMSPVFRQLAEEETKKLNAAYRHALFSLPPLESSA